MSAGRPYFHGDEEFYELDGFVVAHSRPQPCPSGMTVEMAKVLTLDRRYYLGLWMDGRKYGPSAIVWRTSRGDHITPATLDALLARCRDVFGDRPRYRIGAPAVASGR